MTDHQGETIISNINLLILLVDQQISLNNCSYISKGTNISIISFGHHYVHDIPGVHTYLVNDLTSAVNAIMNYYK